MKTTWIFSTTVLFILAILIETSVEQTAQTESDPKRTTCEAYAKCSEQYVLCNFNEDISARTDKIAIYLEDGSDLVFACVWTKSLICSHSIGYSFTGNIGTDSTNVTFKLPYQSSESAVFYCTRSENETFQGQYASCRFSALDDSANNCTGVADELNTGVGDELNTEECPTSCICLSVLLVVIVLASVGFAMYAFRRGHHRKRVVNDVPNLTQIPHEEKHHDETSPENDATVYLIPKRNVVWYQKHSMSGLNVQLFLVTLIAVSVPVSATTVAPYSAQNTLPVASDGNTKITCDITIDQLKQDAYVTCNFPIDVNAYHRDFNLQYLITSDSSEQREDMAIACHWSPLYVGVKCSGEQTFQLITSSLSNKATFRVDVSAVANSRTFYCQLAPNSWLSIPCHTSETCEGGSCDERPVDGLLLALTVSFGAMLFLILTIAIPICCYCIKFRRQTTRTSDRSDRNRNDQMAMTRFDADRFDAPQPFSMALRSDSSEIQLLGPSWTQPAVHGNRNKTRRAR